MSLQFSSKKYIKCYFPERLKQMRNLYKYTQKQVAESIGVSASAYSSWERGIAFPKRKYFIKLCDFYRINSDYLLGCSDDALFCIDNLPDNVVAEIKEIVEKMKKEL